MYYMYMYIIHAHTHTHTHTYTHYGQVSNATCNIHVVHNISHMYMYALIAV